MSQAARYLERLKSHKPIPVEPLTEAEQKQLRDFNTFSGHGFEAYMEWLHRDKSKIEKLLRKKQRWDGSRSGAYTESNFGQESQGALVYDEVDYIFGTKFTCPVNGKIQSLSCYINDVGDNGGHTRYAVYDSSLNQLGITAWTTVTVGINDWLLAPLISSVTVTADTEYWLCALRDSSNNFYYDVGGSTDQLLYQGAVSYSDPLIPDGYLDQILSIFATIQET